MAEEHQSGVIYCIDTWENNAMTEGMRDTFQEFLNNTKPWTKWIVPLRGYSASLVDELRKRTSDIDLLFIDGDHSYEACLADWRAYGPLVRKGGVVAFHDTGWAEGVIAVVNREVCQLVDQESSLPNMWWGRLEK